MTRWAVIDSSSKVITNFIVAETFDIANKGTYSNETPVECSPETYPLVNAYSHCYDEDTNSFITKEEKLAQENQED